MFKFKSIYTKLKNIFTSPSRQYPVSSYKQNVQEAQVYYPENNSQTLNHHTNINDLRNKIIRDELISETAGVETNTLKIVESADEITYSRQVQSLTGNGLETDNREFLVRAAEGHLIKTEELHGGGTCYICGKLTDREHFQHCSVCQCPICKSCSKQFKELTLCPGHYHHAIFHHNTWDKE